mmetsp:Transcript_11015/g.24276  ORF Transcript_11015/g.24276 Transcript_11015/m.24276 type:complete len:942 (+) Transcript_11015:424-3249(+)
MVLHKLKVVKHKLLPLLHALRDDSNACLTLVKIFVMLTRPLSEHVIQGGQAAVDLKRITYVAGKERAARRAREEETEMRLRGTEGRTEGGGISANAKMLLVRNEAVEDLREFRMQKRNKEQITSHANLRSVAVEQTTSLMELKKLFAYDRLALRAFVSLLSGPLGRTGSLRSEEDHLTIELVLHLIRNLLGSKRILHAGYGSVDADKALQEDLVAVFHEEMVLDIMLVLGEQIDATENAHYNLLLMEILHYLFRDQDPLSVAKSGTDTSPSKKYNHVNYGPSLRATLAADRRKLRPSAGSHVHSRHSSFGGTLVLENENGTRQFLSELTRDPTRTANTTTRRRRKKTVKSPENNTKEHRTKVDGSPSHRQALFEFCQKFLTNAYGPMMKSIKNEFRRDSHRLEKGDKTVFFRLIWFFAAWQRSVLGSKSVGQIIHTLDIFTFNLVSQSIDAFIDSKKYTDLGMAVMLYREMVHLLYTMSTSKVQTENIMALGLQEKLYFAQEPIDRLPKLLHGWNRSVHSKEYITDLAELSHVILKIFDQNEIMGEEFQNKQLRAIKMSRLETMKLSASTFNAQAYFGKLVTTNVIDMYTYLLGSFSSNADVVNHRAISFMTRVCRHVIPKSYDESLVTSPLVGKQATLEPMLYNFFTLSVFEEILNDRSMQENRRQAFVVAFVTAVVRRFASETQKNPLLWVEALFSHPSPHRYCELVVNQYVGDDLVLLDEQVGVDRENNLHEGGKELDKNIWDEKGSNNILGDGDTEHVKKRARSVQWNGDDHHSAANGDDGIEGTSDHEGDTKVLSIARDVAWDSNGKSFKETNQPLRQLNQFKVVHDDSEKEENSKSCIGLKQKDSGRRLRHASGTLGSSLNNNDDDDVFDKIEDPGYLNTQGSASLARRRRLKRAGAAVYDSDDELEFEDGEKPYGAFRAREFTFDRSSQAILDE